MRSYGRLHPRGLFTPLLLGCLVCALSTIAAASNQPSAIWPQPRFFDQRCPGAQLQLAGARLRVVVQSTKGAAQATFYVKKSFMRLQRAWGCPPYIPGTGTGEHPPPPPPPCPCCLLRCRRMCEFVEGRLLQ